MANIKSAIKRVKTTEKLKHATFHKRVQCVQQLKNAKTAVSNNADK